MKKRYAKHPKASVIEDINGKRGKKVVEELLWGDLLDVQDQEDGEFVQVKFRPHDARAFRVTGWMKKTDFTKTPLLEVTFVDIGQGDGCVVVTPDQRVIVIDAGEGDNMSRYLHWRLGYPNAKRPRSVHAAVISHPDKDHYLGFEPIFEKGFHASFETIYHNGLVERTLPSAKKPTLGPRTDGKPKVFTDLITDETKLSDLLQSNVRGMYVGMLRLASTNNKFKKFTMLSRENGYMPGFEEDKDISIQVIGPVIETDDSGQTGLRRLGSRGETKNGHSVVLRLIFGSTRVLLGGDLNIPSEKLLLETMVGRAMPKKPKKKRSQSPEEAEEAHKKFVADTRKFIEDARKLIGVDVAKSCHHGSADFSSLFLEAVHPVATVISSGDDEPHSHPRAETLGAIGLASRGERPLIYSTELARSAADKVKDPDEEQRMIKRLHKAVIRAAKNKDREKDRVERAKLQKTLDKAQKKFQEFVTETVQRSVQMYGAIYLRSDGKRAVIGQRFERRGSGGTWDVCQLEPDADGSLTYSSKHAEH